jgi:hypothetical protein
MEITYVYFTSGVDHSTHMVAPSDPDYADVVSRATHWTRLKQPNATGGYKSTVDNAPGVGIYTVFGNTQMCDAFIPNCKNIADRRIRGYDFCVNCAREFAEYTPDPIHIIVD